MSPNHNTTFHTYPILRTYTVRPGKIASHGLNKEEDKLLPTDTKTGTLWKLLEFLKKENEDKRRKKVTHLSLHSNNYPVQQTAHNNARPTTHKSSPRVSEGFNGFLLLPHTPYLHSGGVTDLASNHTRYQTVFQNAQTIINTHEVHSPLNRMESMKGGGNKNVSKPRKELLPRPTFTTTVFTTTTTTAPSLSCGTRGKEIENSSPEFGTFSVLLNQTLDFLNTESAGDPIQQEQQKYEPDTGVSSLQPELIHVNIWNNVGRKFSFNERR